MSRCAAAASCCSSSCLRAGSAGAESGVAFGESLSQQVSQLLVSLAEPEQVLALASAGVASLLVVISAFVRTMIPLRWLAVGSNLGFMLYGVAHPAPLMVALHAVLLPVNLYRVWQMIQLTRHVAASAADSQQLQIWLRPYMRSRNYKSGETIFSSGDEADRLYFLAKGDVDLPEVGRRLPAGQMFGEIAFFAPDRRRSSSARCATDCTLLSIDEDTFKQLVYQNPDFGLEVVRLIAGRLTGDIRRLQAPAAAIGPPPAT
jgi:CRP/FNR family cyclic AMP-dependent transcriptional regulator